MTPPLILKTRTFAHEPISIERLRKIWIRRHFELPFDVNFPRYVVLEDLRRLRAFQQVHTRDRISHHTNQNNPLIYNNVTSPNESKAKFRNKRRKAFIMTWLKRVPQEQLSEQRDCRWQAGWNHFLVARW